MPSIEYDAPFRQGGADFNPLAVESRDVVDWLDRKQPLPIGRWDSIGSEEYARSFTVANSMRSDIVADIYRELLATFDEREGERAFADRVIPILRDKGWIDSERELARRVRLIFDTNLRIARSTARWQRFQRGKGSRPYLRYSAVGDRRTRPSHMALDGIILRIDHPFWQRHFPPWDFNCRCSVRTLADRDLARDNASITSEAELAQRLQHVRPDEGFGTVSPAIASVEANVADIVEAANDRRLPVTVQLVPAPLASRGRSMWGVAIGTFLLELIRRRAGD
jgi:SPP1 gp7 family putative phage head morphogenesis protein